MLPHLPQYATSVDPDVLTTIARNQATALALHERAITFAEAHGGTGYYASGFGLHLGIAAINFKGSPPEGRWSKRRAGYRPYKKSPMWADFAALNAARDVVPGLPQMIWGQPRGDGTSTMYSPQPFLFDAAAYVGFSGPPDLKTRHQEREFGHQWTEVLASTYHLAVEGLRARADAATAATEASA